MTDQDTMRWRYGETNPVTLRIDDRYPILTGDLLVTLKGVVYPFTADIDWENTRYPFIGVAMQSSFKATVDNKGLIRVATCGIFEYEMAFTSESCGIGDWVSVYTSGIQLTSSQIVQLTDRSTRGYSRPHPRDRRIGKIVSLNVESFNNYVPYWELDETAKSQPRPESAMIKVYSEVLL